MNKPEILQGEVIEPTKLLKQLQKDSQKFNEVSDFIEQDFNPKMITKYFEGWKVKNNYYENHSEKMFDGDWIDGGNIWFSNVFILILLNPKRRYDILKNNKPKTLSQFITNCIQAGIKLVWRLKK